MIFLIEYDRDCGQIVSMNSFAETARSKAEEERLELELRLNSEGITNEVVLLEAASEHALRQTHRRYFENLRELTSPSAS